MIKYTSLKELITPFHLAQDSQSNQFTSPPLPPPSGESREKLYLDFVGKIQEKYMGLLGNLSSVEKISINTFIQNILEISKRGSILIGYLGIPGSSDFEIVSTGTLFLEVKLSHGGRPVGHIEDIIVHPNYRGKNLSYFIVNKLISIATVKQCYKVILQCKPELCGIYERNGFIQSGVEMVCRF